MNGSERLLARLRGEPVDRPPNFDILMTYAAHHIGAPLARYYLDHRVLVTANLAVLVDYSLDIVQVISDPFRETADIAAASGRDGLVSFPADGLPVMTRPLLAEPDLHGLRLPAPSAGARMADRLEAVRALAVRVGGEVPVMGWVEGALAEAADLRGVANLLMDLYDRPEWLRDLLARCAELAVAFAVDQVRAGATIVGLGDAVASQVAPRVYRELALPLERRVFDAVHAEGALARLHICGDTTRILADMAASGADIVDVDWMVDIAAAARVLPAVCGNIDPVAVMLQGSPAEVHRAVVDCVQRGGPRSISAAGCEIPDGTPEANLFAQRDALATWGEEHSG